MQKLPVEKPVDETCEVCDGCNEIYDEVCDKVCYKACGETCSLLN